MKKKTAEGGFVSTLSGGNAKSGKTGADFVEISRNRLLFLVSK